MNDKSIIFLDIDGVINTFDNLYSLSVFSKLDENGKLTNHDEFGQLFDERAVRWLSLIVKETNSDIVISSTWRFMGIDILQKMWKKRKLPGKVIGVTGRSPDRIRGNEIKEYINLNKIKKYIIIDDDSDMLENQIPFFIHTDGKFGITFKEYEQALKILNT